MGEYHLFILWEKARIKENMILNDICLHFVIIKQFEVAWSQEFVANNFTRFYGTNLPNNSEKELHCGAGPFLLIVVKDENPIYETRPTSRGNEIVNVNMFDAKTKYRLWTGGGHKIHATNNPKEFNHDITLLLGVNTKDFLEKWGKNDCETKTLLHQDVVGANGWESIEKLFYVLNNTVRYVVLRGIGGIESANYINHTDTDILTDEFNNFWFIANGEACRSNIRPKERITINGINYDLDLWDIYRNYYDKMWANEMISSAIDNGLCKILTPQNDFYCLLYHCLINKNRIADDYIEKLQAYKIQFNIGENDWSVILRDFLSENNYDIPKPNDAACGFHVEQSDIIKEYASRYGLLISRNDTYCNGIHYLTKVYKRDTSFFKVATKDIIDREYCFLKRLENEPYFPKVVGYGALDTDLKYIEITKCQGEDPTTFFENPAHQHLHYIKSFVQEGLKVIQVLIKHNIIHRDIIPRNILVTEKNGKCSINIIDFGWSTDIGDKNAVTPELFGYRDNMGGYSDVYSLGLTLNKIGNNYETRYVFRVREILKQITSVDYADTKFLSRKIEQIQKQLSPTIEILLSEWKFHIKKRQYKELLFSLLPFCVAHKCRILYRKACKK